MKVNKKILPSVAFVFLLGASSCNKWLELKPIDNYSTSTFWKTAEQVRAGVEGLNVYRRNAYATMLYTFGELRAGIYKEDTSVDGMTIIDGSYRLQNIDQEHTVSNQGGIWGNIAICNQLIRELENTKELPNSERDYYLGIAYGERAFYFYFLYKNYGRAPLRLGTEVIDGNFDPTQLYLGPTTATDLFNQIKGDIEKSLEKFGSVTGFNNYGRSKDTWSKATSEALAADFYLWGAKVSVLDKAADPALLTLAKQHLKSLESNYGLSLQANFADVFKTTNKENSEIITVYRFREGEYQNNVGSWTYHQSNGLVNKSLKRADGSSWNDLLDVRAQGQNQAYEYHMNLYQLFDAADTRRDATFAVSYREENGNLVAAGTHVRKNLGHINDQGNRVYDGDIALYRLSWVYLALAEVANMEGDQANVKLYIDKVRARAYGSAWNASVHGFTPTNFKANELAILHEKDKEFVQEGQRWYDLRRMKNAPNGQALVFVPEANISDPTNAILTSANAHKVLWPLNKTLLDSDPELQQTPGY